MAQRPEWMGLWAEQTDKTYWVPSVLGTRTANGVGGLDWMTPLVLVLLVVVLLDGNQMVVRIVGKSQ